MYDCSIEYHFECILRGQHICSWLIVMLLWITDNKIVSGNVAARKTDGRCLIQTQGKHSLDRVGQLLPFNPTITVFASSFSNEGYSHE